MPVFCSFCSKACGSSRSLLTHLRLDHAKHYVGSKVRCGQDGCPRTFQNFRYFKAHLEKHHADLLSAVNEENFESNAGSECNSPPEDVEQMDTNNSVESIPVEYCTSTDLTVSFMSMIGQLESKSNMTLTNIQIIVDNLIGFLSDISQYCIQTVNTMLTELSISPSVSAAEACITDLANLPDCIKTVDTEYKRTQYLKESDVLIEPQEIVLSTRTELRFVSSLGNHVPTVVEDTMQYVPIERTLGAILLQEKYASLIAKFAASCKDQDDGIIGHYFHTESFKKHPYFKKYPDALALNLYVDAFETTNVLGSHTGVHKLEGLYMMVQNFPAEYQSQLSSIFLVALWYAADVKSYGYDKIFEPIVNSLQKLESDEGVEIRLGNKEVTVRACLVFISADNLGYNSLFGFCESFAATKFCRFCECNREEANSLFAESQLKLRSRDSYNTAVSRVGSASYDQQMTGIKRGCLLNNLQYWHVTENFAVDVMHDILEGIAGFELALILNGIAADKECQLSLEKLNSAITCFNYSLADRNSRPPTLSSLNAIRMSASEMWCFLRNLPLLIGSLIPREQGHWNLLKLLLDIADIVFAPVVSDNLGSFLSHLIAEHHSYFKELFPDRQLLPKHHFLVHYARSLKMIGPPVRYWCMRFEARHQVFKELARTTNCFKNVCKTLAKRFQRGLAFQFVNHTLFDMYETGPAEEVVVGDFASAICDAVCRDTNICRNDTVHILSWVKIGHYVFKPTAVAVNTICDGIPQFGIVTDVIAINNKIYFVLEVLETVHYDEHFHAYAVKHPSQHYHTCVSIDCLKDHIPLQYHVIKYEGQLTMFVSLRYTIF
jgi:hypothetical protein